MPYAIELYLDDSSSKKINDIRNKLLSNNITIDEGTDPHISLAIYEDIPVEMFSNELKTFAKKINLFST